MKRGAPARTGPRVLITALALLGCGCIDWDRLRSRGGDAAGLDAGGDAGDLDVREQDGRGDLDPDQPIVAWTFEGAGPAVEVPDLAPRPPRVVVRIDSSSPNLQGAVLEAGTLRLSGAFLSASPFDARAIGDALLAAGGAFTLEAWVESLNSIDDMILVGTTPDGIGLGQNGPEASASVRTSAGPLSVTVRGVRWDQRRHLVVTFRPDTVTATLYLDGVRAGQTSGAAGASLVWSSLDADPRSLFVIGSPDGPGEVRFASIALFDTALSEARIQARFQRGPF